MPALLSTELGLPMAFMSWPEILLILLALFVFGIPILFRVMRAVRDDDGGYR